jgi:Tol biopolymer transport system component
MFRLSLSTGQWTTIPLQGSSWWTGIEWNDDGSAFYFVRHGNAERNGIVRKDVESGREELLYELTTPEAAAVDLEISPDRRWLAFRLLRDKAKGFSVIALNLMSGERRTVASQTAEPSRDGETLRLSGWSPDGRVLVEHRPSGARTPKWLIVPLDGSAAQPLSVDMPPSAFDATWSPDGASIAFVQSAGSSRLLILENPLADLPAIRIGATRR